MSHSIAFGWIDYDISRAPESDRDRIRRLADQLGYRLVWPCERSVLRVVDQVRNAEADLLILPAPGHLSPLELNEVLQHRRRRDRTTPPQLRPLDTPAGHTMSASSSASSD
ncbi:hypothetical protein [Nocardia fusca]|uniref:Uncharacterized protein n=1 Tax=Nocardia fusca TaxID=941183 RepID=A0ABV3F5X2_9NOCA